LLYSEPGAGLIFAAYELFTVYGACIVQIVRLGNSRLRHGFSGLCRSLIEQLTTLISARACTFRLQLLIQESTVSITGSDCPVRRDRRVCFVQRICYDLYSASPRPELRVHFDRPCCDVLAI
jgi:hypothetical protein